MRRVPTLLAVVGFLTFAKPASAQPPQTLKTLCDGRPDCRLLWSKPAGKDDKKRSMTVVDLGLAGNVDYSEPQFNECHAHEIWLVVGDKKVESRQLIAKLCNDGYGARGIGEDTVAVRPNRVRLSKTGGSSWMWTANFEVELSPTPRILTESHAGVWTSAPDHFQSTTWSWDEFAGTTSWSAPSCGDEPVERSGKFAAIPIATVRNTWDWKTTSLGECSLHLTAADEPSTRGGGVVHGKKSAAQDASLRVLGRSDQEFVLEVSDDVFHTKATSWVKRDHVEVWVGDRQGYMDECIDTRRPVQWGIMLDGEVVSAHGKPKQKPKVQIARGDGKVVRMLVKLPQPAHMVTFVYSDSDSGEKQERLIATSELEFGKNSTLGRTHQVLRQDAVCRVEDSKLVVRTTPVGSAKPLIDW